MLNEINLRMEERDTRPERQHEITMEEKDNLKTGFAQDSTQHGGSAHEDARYSQEEEGISHMDQRLKLSFKETLIAGSSDIQMAEYEDPSDAEVSDDEIVEQDIDGPCLSTRLTKEQ